MRGGEKSGRKRVGGGKVEGKGRGKRGKGGGGVGRREGRREWVLDAPAQLGPSNAKKSPSLTERFIPFKATTPESYVFFRSVISRAN